MEVKRLDAGQHTKSLTNDTEVAKAVSTIYHPKVKKMIVLNKELRKYMLNQSIAESCDNVIPQNVANILRNMNLVKREYDLSGSIQDQRCLVIFEGTEENEFEDCIKLRVEK